MGTRNRRRQAGRELWMSLAIVFIPVGALIGFAIGAYTGLYFAHHAPVFGDTISMTIAAPGSPARTAYEAQHVAAFGILMGAVGLSPGALALAMMWSNR